MAALSPAMSNQSADTSSASPAAPIPPSTTTPLTTNASKNLRGLNKPKCIKCGNVARSRCPFQSCKSCCAKAQNPCHIHVLKGSSNIPEKLPSTSSPKVDTPTTDVSHVGSSHRATSLRQLSSNFAQFNNLRPARSRKPPTLKEAQTTNEWRFMKLNEFKKSEIEAENEAFDRYLQNVSLLEEVFMVNKENEDETVNVQTSLDDSSDVTISALKAKLRSNPIRVENIRKRIQYIVSQGLKKLKNVEPKDGVSDESDDLGHKSKKMKTERTERAAALSDLNDKLNKARNEEDLKACMEIKTQLLNLNNDTNQEKSDNVEASETQNQMEIDGLEGEKQEESVYTPPTWFRAVKIDQETLNRVSAHFSTLEDIEEL